MLAALVLAAAINIEESVAILYRQSADGGMVTLCTATAYEKKDGKTYFLTAAHCLTEPGKDGENKVIEDPVYLSRDEPDTKQYVRADIVEVGKQEKSYDYGLLKSSLSVPVIPLGDERDEPAHVDVVNVAAPAGVGLVTFRGNIALKRIDRPLIVGDINWTGGMLADVIIEGGSSGSALVSKDSGKIIGLLVGHWGNLSIAVPVSRVKSPPKEFVLFPAADKK